MSDKDKVIEMITYIIHNQGGTRTDHTATINCSESPLLMGIVTDETIFPLYVPQYNVTILSVRKLNE